VRIRPVLFAVAATAALAAPAHAQKKCPRVELLYDDAEELAEKRTDANGDCRPEEIVKYRAGKPHTAETDSDGDGRFDTFVTYDASGQPAKQERDTDGDGKIDQWVEFEGG
jgi:hypothetical protein